MDFFSATELNWIYWGVFNPIENGLNSICALGHEKAAADATSFLARAVYNGLISKNIYSFVIDPHTSYDNFNPLSRYPTLLSQSDNEILLSEILGLELTERHFEATLNSKA